MMYEVDWIDRDRQKHAIWGYGVPKIVEPEEPADASSIRHLFPHIPGQVFERLPKRRVDILVGLNYNGYFPSGGEGNNCVGHMKVLSTKFGTTGWILGGCHPNLQCCPPKFCSVANEIRINRVNLEVVPKIKLDRQREKGLVRELTTEYYQSDNLGVEPPRRCDKCLKCVSSGPCSEEGQIHSLQDQEELKMIEDGIKIQNQEIKFENKLTMDEKANSGLSDETLDKFGAFMKMVKY